jgi:hypothetical protein
MKSASEAFPPSFIPVFQRAEFWLNYFWIIETGEEFPELANHSQTIPADEKRGHAAIDVQSCHLDFAAGRGHGLAVRFDTALAMSTLFLRSEGGGLAELGFDDQAHWHPHVLRVEELDWICRCAALSDFNLPHPGIPLLLLHRFAPICTDGDFGFLSPMLKEAWRSLGGMSEYDVEALLNRADLRRGEFHWNRSHEGDWTIHQDENPQLQVGLYSLRVAENGEFPFSQLRTLVYETEAACRAVIKPEWRSWNNCTAVEIAHRLAETRRMEGFPILADALEEAGCDHLAILAHLRDPMQPARGAWVVELLLEEPWGSVTNRLLSPETR